MRFAIVASQFNKKITDRLIDGVKKCLKQNGIKKSDYEIVAVPGAFEIPLMCAKLADCKKFDGIIALGCVIKGETDHYKAVCEGVTYGIQKVSIENKIPIMFGVLMVTDIKLALARSEINPKKNKGYECAESLINICGKML